MTKKDYELIASVIKDINQRKATSYRIVELFATALRTTNPLFDEDKFYKACGKEVSTIL